METISFYGAASASSHIILFCYTAIWFNMLCRAVVLRRRAVCALRFKCSHGYTLVASRMPRVHAVLSIPMPNNQMCATFSTGSAPSVVLVKVGTGDYCQLELQDNVLNMNRSHILLALAANDIFGNDLKNVPLGQVKVSVLPSVANTVPTLAEERAAEELTGAAAISSIVTAQKGVEHAATHPRVAVRVTLPPSINGRGLAGLTIYMLPSWGSMQMKIDDPEAWHQHSTEEEVYQALPAESMRIIDRARLHRAHLRGVKALMGLQPTLTRTEAAQLGITVLREDKDGCMASGLFWLPRLDSDVVDTPTSKQCF
jgi:hypothetical protein